MKMTKRLAPRSFSEVRGFTLVETVIVIFVFTLLALGTAELFSHLFVSSRNNVNKIEAVDQARVVLNKIIDELRFAGSNANAYPLVKASGSDLAFDNIEYKIEDNNLYRIEDNESKVVLANLKNAAVPVFTYFDSSYDGTQSPLTEPISLGQVSFVKINLIGESFNLSSGVAPRNLLK